MCVLLLEGLRFEVAARGLAMESSVMNIKEKRGDWKTFFTFLSTCKVVMALLNLMFSDTITLLYYYW